MSGAGDEKESELAWPMSGYQLYSFEFYVIRIWGTTKLHWTRSETNIIYGPVHRNISQLCNLCPTRKTKYFKNYSFIQCELHGLDAKQKTVFIVHQIIIPGNLNNLLSKTSHNTNIIVIISYNKNSNSIIFTVFYRALANSFACIYEVDNVNNEKTFIS